MTYNLEDFNIDLGSAIRGKKNNICDVKGLRVGHVTYDQGGKKTGITAILPSDFNIFKEKLVAASHVINGFGKSVGAMQIDELGTLESPILLTNSLAVGQVSHGLVKYILKDNEDIGLETGTVNPVVCECNDGYLNEIRNMFLAEEDVFKALDSADHDFEEGNIGAGTGMVAYGLKAGIGSSSRLIELDGKDYSLGILVLSNFGRLEDLKIGSRYIGREIVAQRESHYDREDQGSIICILATDIPLSHRQLKRLLKRTTHGIASTGGFTSNGSGEVAIGFSTANKISHYEEKSIVNMKLMNDSKLDPVFKAVKDATEEAIISSLINSSGVIGRDNHKIESLRDYL